MPLQNLFYSILKKKKIYSIPLLFLSMEGHFTSALSDGLKTD